MTETVKVLSAEVDFSEEDSLELSEVGEMEIEKSFRGVVLEIDSPASENLCDVLSDMSGWLISRVDYKTLKGKPLRVLK